MAHTTSVKVRNLLPDLLIAEDNLGVIDSGTLLTLTNPAFGVPTILQDSATLTLTTHFTFVEPRKITLGSAADGENYTATVYVAFSDTEIETFIGESDRIIDNYFVNLTAPASEYLDDWSKYLTAAKILRVKAKGDSDMLKWADSIEKIAMDGMQVYLKRTSAGVFDDSVVTRGDATSVPDFNLDQATMTNYESDN